MNTLHYALYDDDVYTYAGMSNKEVVEEVVHNGYRLTQPPSCPKTLYEKMLECWRDEPDERPTFVDLLSYFRPSSYARDQDDQ